MNHISWRIKKKCTWYKETAAGFGEHPIWWCWGPGESLFALDKMGWWSSLEEGLMNDNWSGFSWVLEDLFSKNDMERRVFWWTWKKHLYLTVEQIILANLFYFFSLFRDFIPKAREVWLLSFGFEAHLLISLSSFLVSLDKTSEFPLLLTRSASCPKLASVEIKTNSPVCSATFNIWSS